MSNATRYRPDGFQDVNPYFVLRQGQADAFIAFLAQAFGAQERFAMRDPDGRLAHGEYLLGDSVVEVGEAAGSEADTGIWTSRFSLHFFVTDVDAVHALALAGGAKELNSPVDHEYGERSSAIEDPAGNRWYIAKALPGR